MFGCSIYENYKYNLSSERGFNSKMKSELIFTNVIFRCLNNDFFSTSCLGLRTQTCSCFWLSTQTLVRGIDWFGAFGAGLNTQNSKFDILVQNGLLIYSLESEKKKTLFCIVLLFLFLKRKTLCIFHVNVNSFIIIQIYK